MTKIKTLQDLHLLALNHTQLLVIKGGTKGDNSEIEEDPDLD